MKFILPLAAIFFLTVSADNCSKKKKIKNPENAVKTVDKKGSVDTSAIVYKGRLEIKAACKNYTIKLLSGNIDTSLIEASWTDEMSKKVHTNVFGLGSICSFPAKIEAGEEFDFVIDPSPKLDCAVCMAYYPTPSRKLSIKVIEK